MQAVGLITEYNPFHNGHLHHLRESKRVTGADVSVAVMSGHFLQRGEPALLDKWRRAEMALAAGVDLVIELPLPWACSSAQSFALGAVGALEAIGGIGQLCFGSEAGDLSLFHRAVEVLAGDADQVERLTAAALRRGETYPQARAAVVEQLAPAEGLGALLAQPNNILGIAYLQALANSASELRPVTVQRIGAGYHALQGQGDIASATGIRRMLAAGDDPAPYLPRMVNTLLQKGMSEGAGFAPQHLFPLIEARLLGSSRQLEGVWQFNHGLIERLQRVAMDAVGLEDFYQRVKPRHLTRTRLQRIVCYMLLDLENEMVARMLETGPLYLHLLGCSKEGESFLAATRKRRQLPLVQNYSRIGGQLKRRYGVGTPLGSRAEELLQLELRASRLYTLLQQSWPGGNRNRDFFEPLRRS